jgi:hypothetical protein
VSVRVSAASRLASRFGPPRECFDARSIRNGDPNTGKLLYKMRPINARQFGSVGSLLCDTTWSIQAGAPERIEDRRSHRRQAVCGDDSERQAKTHREAV